MQVRFPDKTLMYSRVCPRHAHMRQSDRGSVSLSQRCHAPNQWVRKLHNLSGGNFMYFGICALSNNYERFFDNEPNYSWKVNGNSVINGKPSYHNCSRFKEGDTATLTLDCKQISRRRWNSTTIAPHRRATCYPGRQL